MTSLPPPTTEHLASRVAMVGIIAALILTAAGMMLRSPLLGAAGLIIITILVLFRQPLARLIERRRR